MKILLVVISIIVLFIVLTIIGSLKINHRIRYANGYDSELENDYQALIAQAKEKGEKEKKKNEIYYL